MKYSWILFDADGTLFDYAFAEHNALKQSFIESGLVFTEDSLSFYRDINLNIWKDYEKGLISQEKLKTKRFDLLFKKLNMEHDSDDFSKKYLNNLSKISALLPGAQEVVEQIPAECNLAMITNGLTSVQQSRFDNSTISEYFEYIFISEAVGSAKPDPGIFEFVFDKLLNPPKDKVLIVGDSLSSDIQGGINFGIDTCWYNPAEVVNDSELNPTYEVHKLIDVLPVIKKR